MKEITSSSSFNGHNINTGDGRYTSYNEILNCLYQHSFNMLTRYSRVFIARADLHFPIGYASCNNRLFSSAISWIMRDIRRYATAKYVAVREVGTGNRPHYHVVIICDGRIHQNGFYLKPIAERYWSTALNVDATGLVEIIEPYNGNSHAGFMLTRDNPMLFDEAFHWMSYIAKTNTKGNTSYRERELLTSRLD